jgi:Tol biopolymer transport system component/DNA-binding winged helix-turn-helix (wHTH) protein
MQKRERLAYEFGPFRFIPAQRLLLRDGKPVSLTLKAFNLLHVLIQNRGHIVGKDELMKEVWPDQIVEESNLTQHISLIRKTLGENPKEARYIETVQRYGYRFIAPVKEQQDEYDVQTMLPDGPEEDRADTHSEIPADDKQPLASRTHQVGRPNKLFVLTALTLVGIGLGLVAFGLFKRLSNRGNVRKLALAKLTNAGNVRNAIISPDGKYIVYLVEDVGRYSIWARHVDTTSGVQITSPVETQLLGLTFSRDGKFIYYLQSTNISNTLRQVPMLGGASRELLHDVDSPVTVSPDDMRIAFTRRLHERGATALVVANADGTDEQQFVTRKPPDFFVNHGLAWSPDGKLIACVVGSQGNILAKIVGVRVADGTEEVISSQSMIGIDDVEWVPDGSGLIVTTTYQQTGNIPPKQIWRFSYPGGQATRITNDLSDYYGVSLAKDSSSIVSVERNLIGNITVVDDSGGAPQVQQVNVGSYYGFYGLAWAAGDRIVYVSSKSGNSEIWGVGVDGSNPIQLTSNVEGNIFPAVSPDGRTIVFVSLRDGGHIWRMDGDGTQQYQLTHGITEMQPQISPDGRFVVYIGSYDGQRRMWKIPIEGGAPTSLTESRTLMPAISPDGRQVACYYFVDKPKSQWRIALVPFDGGPPVKLLDMPTAIDPYLTIPLMRWTPDGRALTYVNSTNGISNIWKLPLDGGTPTKLTDFKDSYIFAYEWTRDGKRLLLARGNLISDAVIIRDFN